MRGEKNRGRYTIRTLRPAAVLIAVCAYMAVSGEIGWAMSEIGICCLPQASVGAPILRLRDIAVVDGGSNDAAKAQIETLDLGAAPQPGNRRLIKLDYIKIRLRQAGFDPATLVFSGAQEICVTAAAQNISGAQLVAVAEEYVRQRLPWPASDVQIGVERQPPDVAIPPGEYTLEVKNCSTNDWLGKIFMQMRIQNADAAQTVPLILNVRRFGTVLVAKERIEKGRPLTAAAVELRREEIKDSGGSVQDPAQFHGRRARLPIAAGQTIQERMLEKIPLVSRRQILNAQLETPALRIMMKVQAAENGSVGDIIRVQNIDSKKELLAEVVSDTLVRIVR
ncbi:MAG: flagellar basal body P-ring formation chaperone FlgA [Candidatus Omnitrophica bacterium]|nr:flagellar basal body P-ring formation chaperone FlgA [Candidatus Omnitrophota bacterium]